MYELLPLAGTDDAGDASAPTSPRALCLLLLAQARLLRRRPSLAHRLSHHPSQQRPPVDASSALPYDALPRLVGGDEAAVLGAVVLGTGGGGRGASLLASSSSSPLAPVTVDDDWLALALALRYGPLGCRLFVEAGAWAARSFDATLLAERFPTAVAADAVAAAGASAGELLREAFRRDGEA